MIDEGTGTDRCREKNENKVGHFASFSQEFKNYPGSIFFVKALATPPPSCLPNKVCFHPKMVCFSHPSFEEISGCTQAGGP